MRRQSGLLVVLIVLIVLIMLIESGCLLLVGSTHRLRVRRPSGLLSLLALRQLLVTTVGVVGIGNTAWFAVNCSVYFERFRQRNQLRHPQLLPAASQTTAVRPTTKNMIQSTQSEQSAPSFTNNNNKPLNVTLSTSRFTLKSQRLDIGIRSSSLCAAK